MSDKNRSKYRDPYALDAKSRKAGPMKDKRSEQNWRREAEEELEYFRSERKGGKS